MPLKKSIGNMYDWVTHMHTHLAGECPHKCIYCYVQTNPHGVSSRYKGEPRLVESELDVNYGILKTIFIEHMSDLFAEGIKDEWIEDILNHCRQFPRNKYVFQTKNVLRLLNYYIQKKFPDRTVLVGTTIETNRNTFDFGLNNKYDISKAPFPHDRYRDIKHLREKFCPVFVTIEPIIDFDLDIFSSWIIDIEPNFVNIGADSKNCHLPEPSKEKILKLVDILRENKITIKRKTNLERLLR